MLFKLFHLSGRVFGILMGWRRTHRPGDLTARIFIERDRVLNSTGFKPAMPMTRANDNFLSTHKDTIKISGERIKLRASSMVGSDKSGAVVTPLAPRARKKSKVKSARPLPNGVIWLSSKKPKQVAMPVRRSLIASNVIALHTLATPVPGVKRAAA